MSTIRSAQNKTKRGVDDRSSINSTAAGREVGCVEEGMGGMVVRKRGDPNAKTRERERACATPFQNALEKMTIPPELMMRMLRIILGGGS